MALIGAMNVNASAKSEKLVQAENIVNNYQNRVNFDKIEFYLLVSEMYTLRANESETIRDRNNNLNRANDYLNKAKGEDNTITLSKN